MTKKDFDPTLFSLTLLLSNDEKINIEIPKSKKGYHGKTVGGEKTYHMAIDAFTINFSNKNELLDYLRDNNLAPIDNISNNNISVMITYDDKIVPSISNKIAYDGSGIEDFIKNTPINDSFYYEANSYGTSAYNTVNSFKNRVLPLYYESPLSDYFSRYIKKLFNFSNHELYSCLNLGYDKEEYDRSGRIFPLNDSAFYEYENIRWFLLTDFKELEMSLAQKRYDDSPYTADERKDAQEDFEEILLSIDEKYTEESVEKPISFKNFKGPYTIDPEEEMEMFNHPIYEEENHKTRK